MNRKTLCSSPQVTKLNSPAMRLLRRQLHSGIGHQLFTGVFMTTALDCAAFVVASGLDDLCDEISGSAQ
jgi:hypothetical protein